MNNSRISRLLERHELLRREGLNLVVSENSPSSAVRNALASDLCGRYAASWYGGGAEARLLVEETERLARELFRAEHPLVSALSGNLCDLAVLFAFTRPGDGVAMLPFASGGYPLGLEKFGRRRIDLPLKPDSLEIDAEAAVKKILEEQGRLVILGASCFLFPHPVKEIRRRLDEADPEIPLVYDGSHVLGLIACKVFQDPLREGAQVLIGSTHKSFYGPQGGLLLTDREDLAGRLRSFLELDLEGGIGLVDNPHVNRIAALGLALEEMLEDQGYGARVVQNAKALAKALDRLGVPVRFRDRDYTESHQIMLDLPFARSEELCRNLEQAGIFIDIGGRIGTAEATHRGLDAQAMEEAAALIAAVFFGSAPSSIRDRVRSLAGKI